LIKDSEYIETILIAVPVSGAKDFVRGYETVNEWVVPRSYTKIAEDDEFVLYGVVVFKKFAGDFVHKCRERKWTPRDYKYVEGGKEEEKKEVEKVQKDETKLYSEALRLGRTAWGEAVMVWIHVLALRVFVETVLRYGLPLDFASGIVNVSENLQLYGILLMEG
jgi:V-type H+-transporting ATPase subunit C